MGQQMAMVMARRDPKLSRLVVAVVWDGEWETALPEMEEGMVWMRSEVRLAQM